MGIAYRVDVASGLIVAVVDGVVTADDFYDFARRQDDDPDWHRATRSLTDAGSAVTKAVPSETLDSLAATYARLRAEDQSLMAAIVAGQDFEQFSRYGEIRTGVGSRTIAFNSIATACTWLGIDLRTTSATVAELRKSLRAAPPSPSPGE
jgi:hypothetical protein